MATITELLVRIGADIKGLTSGLNQSKQQVSQFSQGINKVGGMIAGAFAVGTIINFGKEISQLAGVAEGVEAAFKRMGGGQYLDGLREATKGTVSDLELMKGAVQANNFDIPLNQLASLFAFAHQRAKDTGQSVDYLVQSIVLGIGRKSPLILDNLGISAVQLREKFKGLNAEQQTVADVAKAVGEIASESMAKVGEQVDTASEKFARNRAQIANYKVMVGAYLNELLVGLTNFVGGLVDTFDDLGRVWGSEFVSGWEKFAAFFSKGKELDAASEKLQAIDKQASQLADTYMGKLKNSLKEFGGESEDATDKAMDFLKAKRSELVGILGEFQGIDKAKMSDAMKVVYSETQKEYKAISDLINSPLGIEGLLFKDSPEKTIRTIKTITDEITELQRQLGEETATTDNKTNISINKKIDALTKEKEAVEGVYAAYKKAGRLKEVGNLDKLTPIAPGAISYNKEDQSLPSLKEGVDISGFMGFFSGNDQNKMEEFTKAWENVGYSVVNVTDTMRQGITNFVVDFSAAIGDLLAGTASFEDIGAMVLKSVGSFMSSMGQQLIALGVAKIVADTALAIPGGGFALVAAGAALVAAGGLVSTMGSSPFAGGGGNRSSSGSNGFRGLNQNNKLQIEGVLKGTDIYWSQKRFNSQYNNTTAR